MRRRPPVAHRGTITKTHEESRDAPHAGRTVRRRRAGRAAPRGPAPTADPQRAPSPSSPTVVPVGGGGATGRDRHRVPPATLRRRPTIEVGDRRYSRPRACRSPGHQPGDDRANVGPQPSPSAGARDGRRTQDDELPAVALVAGEAGRRQDSPAPGARRLDSCRDARCSSPKPSPARSAGRSTSSARCSATPRPTSSTLAPWRSTPWPSASVTAGRWSSSRTCTGRTRTASGCSSSWRRCRCPMLTLVATYRPDELTSRLPGGEMVVRLERRRHVHQVHLERLDHHEVARLPRRRLRPAARHGCRRRPAQPHRRQPVLPRGDPRRRGRRRARGARRAAAAVDARRAGQPPARRVVGIDERQVIEAAAVLGPTGPVRRAGGPHRPFRGAADRRPAQPRRAWPAPRGGRRPSSASATSSSATPSRTSCSVANGGDCTNGRSTYCASRWAPTSPTSPATPPVPASYDEMVELARDGVGHYLDIGATHQALRLAVAALAEAPDDLELLAGADPRRLADRRPRRGVGARRAPPRVDRRRVGGERHATAVRLAARVAHERSDVDRMWQLVDELERLVDVLPPGEERAATMAAIAQINMLHDRSADAIEWADRAIGEADSVGAKAVRVQAMIERATAMTELPDRRADGIGALIDAVAEAEQIEDWVLLARALHNLSNATQRCRAVEATSSGCATPGGGPASTTWSPPTTTSASPNWPRARAMHRRCGSTSRGSACRSRAAPAIGRSPSRSDCCSKSTESTRRGRCSRPGPDVTTAVADDKHRLSSHHLMLAGRAP